MTSSKMENPLWKKLQNDPTLLKYQQQQQQQQQQNSNQTVMANNLSNLNNLAGGLTNLNVFNNLNSLNELNLSSLSNLNQISNLLINENAMLQQQQQPVSPSQQPRSSNISPNNNNNNNMFNNFNQYQQLVNGAGNGSIDPSAIHNLNQLMMSKKPSENGNEPSNYQNGNGMQQQREIGVIEKIVGSYGFVKCLTRDYRLYFHLNSYQSASSEPKVGDLVEFEEGYDKRNGKPCAINLIKHERAGSAHSQFNLDSPLNLMNLKELLHKNSSSGGENGQVYKQQQNFQYLMNGLKMLNMQQGVPNGSISNGYESLQNANNDTAVNNLNSIMGLFNKENVTGGSSGGGGMSQNQAINNNILNMAKALAANNASAAAAAAGLSTSSFGEISDGLKKNDIISNEVMEGIVAIPAMKRTVNNLYVSFWYF